MSEKLLLLLHGGKDASLPHPFGVEELLGGTLGAHMSVKGATRLAIEHNNEPQHTFCERAMGIKVACE